MMLMTAPTAQRAMLPERGQRNSKAQRPYEVRESNSLNYTCLKPNMLLLCNASAGTALLRQLAAGLAIPSDKASN